MTQCSSPPFAVILWTLRQSEEKLVDWTGNCYVHARVTPNPKIDF